MNREILNPENPFFKLLESSSIGILVQNNTGEILFVNSHLLRQLEIPGKDVLNENIIDLINKLTFYDCNKKVLPLKHFPTNLVLKNNAPLLNEVIGIQVEKSMFRWFLTCSNIIHGTAKESALVMTTFEDTDINHLEMNGNNSIPSHDNEDQKIINNKYIQVDSISSANIYKTIAELVNDWIYWIDPENNIIFMSSSCYKITGYASEEFINNPGLVDEIIHPIEIELVNKKNIQSIKKKQGKETDTIIYRIIKKDKSTAYLEQTYIKIYDENNEYIGCLVNNKDITVQCNKEQELTDQRNQYLTLVENIPDFIVRYGKDLKRSYVNPAWEKASGISAKDVIQVEPRNISGVPNPVQENYYKKIKQVFKTGKPDAIQFSWTNANGEDLYLQYKMVPEYDHNGILESVLSIGYDLSKLHRILENIGIGVALISPEMKILELNKCMRKWFPNVSPILNPICYKSFNDPPRKEVCNYCPVKKTLKDGSINIATTETPKGGIYRNYRIISSPLFNDNNEVVAAIEMVEDITEQKKSEQLLKASEARYIDLYENAPDMYLSVDAKTGVIIECNKKLAEVLGVEKKDLLGRQITDIYHPDCYDEVKDTLKEFKNKGVIRNKELKLLLSDGSIMDVSLNVSAVRDEQGKILYSRSILHDISEIKRNDIINNARLLLIQFAEQHSMDELLEETLNQLEGLTGSSIGFFHFVSEDQQSLILQNWSTRTKTTFCRAMGKGLHYSINVAGVWVEAVRQRKAVIHNDYNSLPNKKGMPEGHAAVTRELVVPIIRAGKIKAVIGVGNKKNDYNNSDIEVTALLSELVWDIIENQRSIEALNQSEQKFREVFNIIEEALSFNELIYNDDGKIIDYKILEVNPAFEKESGFIREQIVGQNAKGVAGILCDIIIKKIENNVLNNRIIRFDYFLDNPESWKHIIISKPVNKKFVISFSDVTEAKRIESELQKSHEKYRLITENTADTIRLLDFNLKPLYISPSIYKLRGYTIDEVMEQPLDQVLTPDSLIKFKRAINEKLTIEAQEDAQNDYNILLELKEYCKNKTTIWVELSASFIYDENQKPVSILTVTRDITLRKIAEFKLQHSERLKSILNLIAEAFLTTSDDVIYSKINSIFIKALKSKYGLFGYIGRKGELIIPSFSSEIWEKCQVPDKTYVFPRDSWGESIWGRALKEKKALISEGPFKTPSGHIRIKNFLTAPILYKNKVIGVLAVANSEKNYTDYDCEIMKSIAEYLSPILKARLDKNISDRKKKRAQKLIRKLSHAVEQSSTSIIITGKKGIIEYVNPKFCEITGYAEDEVIGKNPRIIKSGETPLEVYQDLWSTILSGKEWKGELHNKKKNGDLFWESASISPIKNKKGKIKHFVAIKEDITEIKKIRDEISESREKLRNLGLHTEKIREEEKKKLAYLIHDDIGQSLTAIKLNLMLLSNSVTLKTEIQKKYKNNLDALVDSTISKIRNLATELRPAILDHLGLISSIEWQLNEVRKQTGIKCTLISNVDFIQLDDFIKSIYYRIFQESLTNILRHAQAKNIEIDVDMSESELKMVISDDGKGFLLEKVNDPKSFGLLAMKERASSIGGTCKIESLLNFGTTITIKTNIIGMADDKDNNS